MRSRGRRAKRSTSGATCRPGARPTERARCRSLPRAAVPYKCRWCSHQVYGQTHRRRKPRGVVDEVEWLLKRTSRTCCGLPTMSSRFITAGCRSTRRKWQARGCSIPFECISRADRMNAECCRTLAESGLLSSSGSARKADRNASSTPCSAASRSSRCSRAVALCRDGHPDRHVPDVGLRRRRTGRTSRPPSSM